MGSCQFISAIPLQRRLGFGLILSLILVFAAGKAILFDTLDPDFFWHYRVAQQLQRDGVGPIVDNISFASLKTPWTPYSWLAELGMKEVWDQAGLTGAVLIQSFTIAGIFGMVTLSCRQLPDSARQVGIAPSPGATGVQPKDAAENRTDKGCRRTLTRTLPHRLLCEGEGANERLLATLLTTALAAGVSLPYLSFRPATLATLILAIIAWLLLRDRRLNEKSKLVWVVPILTAICVNIHFFAIFAVLWAGALLVGNTWEHLRRRDDDSERRMRRGAVLLVTVVVGFLATPMLPGMLKALISYRSNDPMVHSEQIAELAPFWRGVGGMIVAGVLILGVLVIAIKARRIRAGELIWLGGMLVLAAEMGRFLPLAVIIFCPLLTWTLPPLSDRPLQATFVRYAAASLAFLCIARIAMNLPASDAMPSWLNRHGADAPGYPIAAAEFVGDHIPPRSHRLINEFTWGGYLAFRLGDQFQVLLDGRTQVHSPEFWRTTYLGTEAQMRDILKDSNGDAAILPLNKSRFKPTLIQLGWMSVFKDDRAEVLVPPTHVARTTE